MKKGYRDHTLVSVGHKNCLPGTVYKKALNSQLLQDLIADRKPLYFGPARVLSDDPDKLVNVIDGAHMKLA